MPSATITMTTTTTTTMATTTYSSSSPLGAMGCSLLVSMASPVCLVLLPVIFCSSRGNHQRPWWIALPPSWS
ncbi:hypothetical protein DAI22_02g151001 [Oryza sativa Japonica Group]|nr:hypothetical protein DAI22_02g151001 [Oryza sativa Japonica Group]